MKKFSEYMNEMAYISGIHDNKSFSLKDDWDNHFNGNSKLIINKLPGKLKIYSKLNFYFLVDKDDEYLGFLELKDVSKIYDMDSLYQVKSSNQIGTVKGFYNIIFSTILAKVKKISKIISDNNLSTNALNSYDRLNKTSKLDINMFSQLTKEESTFNKKELSRDPSLVVIINETQEIKETLKEYLYRIENQKVFMNEYQNDSASLMMFLYSSEGTTKEDLL